MTCYNQIKGVKHFGSRSFCLNMDDECHNKSHPLPGNKACRAQQKPQKSNFHHKSLISAFINAFSLHSESQSHAGHNCGWYLTSGYIIQKDTSSISDNKGETPAKHHSWHNNTVHFSFWSFTRNDSRWLKAREATKTSELNRKTFSSCPHDHKKWRKLVKRPDTLKPPIPGSTKLACTGSSHKWQELVKGQTV